MKIPLSCRIFGLLVLSVSAPASADVPASLHHQGRIAVDGINFDGSGRFRFLLFHQGEAGSPITPVWKNDDGTPDNANEPVSHVNVEVTKGLYAVSLGGGAQAPLPPDLVPPAGQNLHLRIWFDDGIHGSQQLSPDQAVDAVAFARHAAEARTVPDGSITPSKLSPSISIPDVQSGRFAVSPFTPQPFTVTYPTAFGAPPVVTATPAIAQPSSISGITNTQFRATLPLPVGLGTSGLGIEGSSAETSVTAVDGRPAIAFSGGANSTLHYAINFAADGSGTWTITEVDASVAAESKSLAVIGGKPAIAYRAGESQNELKFAISSNPDGSGVWATSSVEAGSTSHGLFASLAQVDGRPAISYLSHPGLLYLRFAINSAADGSGTWSFTSVDTDTTSNGFYSSLHVINGRPAISYQDRRNYDLRFAINTDTDGSGAWIRTTVDAPGNVGRYTSLSVVDGRPAISYEKTSDPQSLRFAINTSPDASGAWTISAVTGVTSPIATHLGVIAGAPAILCGSDRGLEIVTNSSPDGSGTWSRLTIDSNTFWQENVSFAVLGEKPMAGFLGRQDAPGSLEPKIWIEPVVPFHWIAVGPGN
jgi:hypothetical protein